MPPVSRDMQSVLRDLRALYRCWGFENLYCTPYGVVLTHRIKRLARCWWRGVTPRRGAVTGLWSPS